METLMIELTHEKALNLLKDLESMDIIRFVNPVDVPAHGVRLGSLADKYSIPDDFNDPLDDLKEYR